jgi:hypothetical protein
MRSNRVVRALRDYSTVYSCIEYTRASLPSSELGPPNHSPASECVFPLDPKIIWCNVSPSPTDVSPTENSWMLHPLDKVSLGYFAPNRTIPSLNSDLIERSDTRLPTAARFSAAKRWSSMCGPIVHPTEGRQSNKPGQGRRPSRPDGPLIHKAPEADGASSMLEWSRVGTHWSGGQFPRNALFKGRIIQEFSVGDASVGDTSTLHRSSDSQCRSCNCPEFDHTILRHSVI